MSEDMLEKSMQQTKALEKSMQQTVEETLEKMDDKLYETMTYKIGAVRYKGVYLDGVYTRQEALAIKNEVESVLKFFEHTDNVLKKSMKVEDEPDSSGT